MKQFFFFLICMYCFLGIKAQELSIQELDSLSSISFVSGDYVAAESYADRFLQKAIEKGVDSIHVRALYQLAQVCDRKAKYEKMLSSYQKALVIHEQNKSMESQNYALCIKGLGQYYYRTGDFKEAEKYYTKAKPILAKVFGYEHFGYAEILYYTAILYLDMGKYEKAELLFKELLLVLSKITGKDNENYTSTLGALGGLYEQMGHYEESELCHKESMAILEKIFGRTHINYAYELNNLAKLYMLMDRLEESIFLYEEAENIVMTTVGRQHPVYAIILNGMGMVYKKAAQFEKAVPTLNKALNIVIESEGKQHPSYLGGINNLALCYMEMGDFDSAEKIYKQCISEGEISLGKSHPDLASFYQNYVLMLIKQNKFAPALGMMPKIFEIRSIALGNIHTDYIASLNIMANILNSTKAYEEGIVYARKALQLNAKDTTAKAFANDENLSEIFDLDFNYNKEALKSIHNLSILYSNIGEGNKAFSCLQGALKINQKIRNEFSSDANKINTLEQNAILAEKALALASSFKDRQVYANEAFRFAELNKSLLLTDAVKGQRARILGDAPDSLVLKELELQKELSKTKKQLLNVGTSEQKSELITKLNQISIEVESFKKELETNYPQYYKLKYNNITVTAADVQKNLDEKTGFLEYFVGDSLIYLLFLTKTEIQLYSLKIANSKLTGLISDLRKSLSDYEFIKGDEDLARKLYIKSGFEAYRLLLSDALKEANQLKNLIIVADGELGHLPFEAFLTEEVKEEKPYSELPYLLNKYAISYNYSATLWKENLDAPKKQNNGRMLAAAASYKGKEDSSAVRANRAPHLRNLRDALQDLPAAKEEVAALSGLFAGDFFYGDKANEQSFKAKANDYAIIHLAMHGILNSRAPILSSLAFTENGDSSEDNFLEAWEIAHIKLNANLVVLSACETGYGKFQQGEGVMSLARSFMYAGVPSLVVSMWQVNDQSTSLIMQSFYKNLAKGMDKAEALRQAKLEYIGSADDFAAHPAFWAPFVQLGDSRPIAVEVRGGGLSMWWIGGGLAAVAAVGGVVALRRRGKG